MTDAGASEPLAMVVVDVARQAGTGAAGELVTRPDFGAGMTRLEVAAREELRVAAGLALGDGPASRSPPRSSWVLRLLD